MNKLLKDLYDCFYIPLELSAQKKEIEECHQALIKVLDKPECRLALQIIDAKAVLWRNTSIDSFISGFELTWRLSAELNQYEKSVRSLAVRRRDWALFLSCAVDCIDWREWIERKKIALRSPSIAASIMGVA